MKLTSKVLAFLLAFASTAAWAQATATTTTTTTEVTTTDVTATKVAPAMSLFPESSVYLWSRYFLNNAKTGKNDLIFTPHFRTPILNNFVVLDAYVDMQEKHGTSHGSIGNTFVDFEKVLVDNENFLIQPYAELVNPGRDKNGQALLYFYGVAKLPVATADGKITPFLMTESSIGINTTKVDLAENTTYQSEGKKLSLTAEEQKTVKPATEDSEYVYSVYGRVGFEFEPAVVNGLKITAATNIIAAPKNTYAMDVATNKIVDTTSHWNTTTQPMLRLEYKASEHVHLRNDTTYDFQDYFQSTTAKQEKAGKISNMTRLTYTIF